MLRFNSIFGFFQHVSKGFVCHIRKLLWKLLLNCGMFGIFYWEPDTRAEDTRAEDTRADGTRAEDTRAEDTRADDTRAEDTRAEDTREEDTRADDMSAEGKRAEDTRAKDTRAYDTLVPRVLRILLFISKFWSKYFYGENFKSALRQTWF